MSGFDAVDAYIRKLIDVRLAELGITRRDVATYDATHLPSTHKSVEAFYGECRRLKLNPSFKVRRSWSVPVDIWEQARREDRDRRRGPRTESAADPIDQSLQKAGLRLIRGRP
jgi:hypothetical protein